MNGNRGFEKLRVFCILGAATASVGMLPSANGAVISFSGPMTMTGNASDVDTAGTLVEAFDWDTATTVNGVPFAASVASNNGSTSADVDGSTNAAVLGGFDQGEGVFFPTVYSGSQAAYEPLIAGAVFSSGGSATLTLNGLTAGLEYEVEIWVSDSRGSLREENLSDAFLDNPVTLDFSVPTSIIGQPGQYAIGTFLSDGNPQLIYINPLTSQPSAQINAFQVRQIPIPLPEPATIGLLGIASLGMLARRRRA
jgi:hypothetical protein